MPDARIDDHFTVFEVAPELLGGLSIHGRICATPDQECGDVGQRGDHSLQFAQIVRPVADDADCVFEAAGNRDRCFVTFQSSGRNALAVPVEAG